MFREMRRKKQQLPFEDTLSILNRASSGVLAVSGDHDYPYAVPLSFVYHEEKLFFHAAKTGHKLDAIARNPKVSFCVIDLDQVVPEEYTTYFRSVILFGRARILEDPTEKRQAFELLAAKYTPDDVDGRLKEIESQFERTTLIEVAVDHMTGKEAIELVRAKSPRP